MSPSIKIAIIAAALAAMGGIGACYEFCISPNEATVRDGGAAPSKTQSVWWDDTYWGEHSESIASALNRINHRSGCKVLYRSAEPGADIEVHPQAGHACGHLLHQKHPWDSVARAYDCGTNAHIAVAYPGDTGMSHKILVHEFMHALGFVEDSFEQSIMYGALLLSDAHQYITNADVRVLKERYCR